MVFMLRYSGVTMSLSGRLGSAFTPHRIAKAAEAEAEMAAVKAEREVGKRGKRHRTSRETLFLLLNCRCGKSITTDQLCSSVQLQVEWYEFQ